jgi:pimeloyl-ACP methyl ester carboxylesterase
LIHNPQLLKKLALQYYRAKLGVIALFSKRKAAEIAFRMFCTPYTKRKRYVVPPIFNNAEKLSFSLTTHHINGFRWTPEKKNGNKVLICHGFDSYSYRFHEFIQPLLNEGFEVLAFDAPGHGISSGNQITMPVYQQMIIEIHKRFGPVNGIMAHSLGGLGAGLAIEKMEDHQHKRFVLISPATESTRAIEAFFKLVRVSNEVKNEFEKLIMELGGYPSSWYSVSRIMQEISTRTLWIHDEEDSITPFDDMKHLLEKQLPHIQFEITKGLGHSLYQDKLMAKKIIAFLSVLKDKSIHINHPAI